jgi:hypothetical protein
VRGRASVFVRAGRLEVTLARHPAAGRPRYDFSAFTDAELEELAILAARAEAAGGEPTWTEAETVVLNRLEAKLRAATGDTR